jgi:fructose-1,6-bisphosphatase/inositol monophosphatase family enzyme
LHKSELRIYKHAHKECMAPARELSKTADMKGGTPITQIDDEVEIIGIDRLQSNFKFISMH